MEMMRATTFLTSLGWIAVCWRRGQTAGLCFGQRTEVAAREALTGNRSTRHRSMLAWLPEDELNEGELRIVSRLRDYTDGSPDDFLDVAIDLSELTPFEQRVIRSCRRIGYGRTTTYGELAERSGAPRAARAVGNVMRKNRLPLIIPCHRVLASGGALGGYSAPEGLAMKKRLLRLESLREPALARP